MAQEFQIGGFLFRLTTLPDGTSKSEVVKRTFEPEPEPLVQLEGTLLSAPSKSELGLTHYVKLSKDGTIYCTCFGFRAPNHCWHWRAVQDVLKTVSIKELINNPLVLK